MGQGFAEIAREILAKRCAKLSCRMSSNSELVTLAHQRLYPNYRPAPLALVRGRGCELFDADGRRLLDLCAGVAVCSVGHAHPTLTRAIAEQAARLMHVSNYFYNEPNIRLADELCRRTGFERAFFCNSGTEANEALLKLARHHFFAKGKKERVRVVAFENAFHGRSLGALSMTGTPKYREGFGPLGPVTHVPYGDADAVERAMGTDVCAIIVEPLQGEGGVVPAPPGFLAKLRAIADRHGALLLVGRSADGHRSARAVPRHRRHRARGRTQSRSPRASAAAFRSAPCSRPRSSPARCRRARTGPRSAATLSRPRRPWRFCGSSTRRTSSRERASKGEALGEMLQKLVHELPDACVAARGRGVAPRPGAPARLRGARSCCRGSRTRACFSSPRASAFFDSRRRWSSRWASSRTAFAPFEGCSPRSSPPPGRLNASSAPRPADLDTARLPAGPMGPSSAWRTRTSPTRPSLNRLPRRVRRWRATLRPVRAVENVWIP